MTAEHAWNRRAQAAWVQTVLGFGPISAELSLLPPTLPVLLAAPAAKASGVTQTIRQVGGAIGLAVLGAIVAAITSSRLGASSHATGAVHLAVTSARAAAYWVAAVRRS